MAEKLDRFGPAAAGIFLIWFCYSALQGEEANALLQPDEKKSELPTVPKKLLEPKVMAPPALSRDPFEAKWATLIGLVAPPKKAAEVTGIEGFEEEDEEQDDATGVIKIDDQGELIVEVYPDPFTLSLESVLDLPGSGQALICGHTVREGEAIPGLDEQRPPILRSVDGASASIRYRGRTYVLDLWERQSIEIDIRPKQKAEPVPEGPRTRSRSRRRAR